MLDPQTLAFQRAVLCIVEANQLSSKIADEILRSKPGRSDSFGGLASGFNRIAFRLEALESDKTPNRFNWSQEEREALVALLEATKQSGNEAIAVARSKVDHLFFPEGQSNV